jgi:hypothetical protein
LKIVADFALLEKNKEDILAKWKELGYDFKPKAEKP